MEEKKSISLIGHWCSFRESKTSEGHMLNIMNEICFKVERTLVT